MNVRRSMADVTDLVATRIRPLVERFRDLQEPDGRVLRQTDEAARLLRALLDPVNDVCRRIGHSRAPEAFEADVQAWVRKGLDSEPDFSAVRDDYEAPRHGELAFFIGPTLTQNGPPPRGHFLETLLVLCEEPESVAVLRHRFPHAGKPCQTTRMLAASAGFGVGNCIVFFPEYVAARRELVRQGFSVFLFNKFIRIYLLETIPNVIELFGERDALFDSPDWVSTELSPSKFYALRCMWGVLHDYYHHVGPRPLHEHLMLKQDWHLGTLEELKVDCQTVLVAEKERFEGWQALIEFVLFDRMFRYPAQRSATLNFDAATGCLLFEWLWEREAIYAKDGALRLSWSACRAALELFVEAVEANERVSEDEEYMRRSRELVRRYLPAGEEGGDSYRVPDNYRRLATPYLRSHERPMNDLPY